MRSDPPPATPPRGDAVPRAPVDGVPMRYEQYRALPEGPGYNLLGGLVFREPMPTVAHQVVVDNVLALLRRHARATRAGRALREIDVHLDAENAPVPDVCFVGASRLRHLRPDGLHGVAPDLCVEVLSLSSRGRDRIEKAALYACYGCLEYWIVDPERRRVEVLRAHAPGGFVVHSVIQADGVLDSSALPGLRVDAAEVFAQD